LEEPGAVFVFYPAALDLHVGTILLNAYLKTVDTLTKTPTLGSGLLHSYIIVEMFCFPYV